MPVEVRLLKEEEAAKANDLHNRINRANRTLHQFLWEFFNCPWGKSIYVVAVDTDNDDKIVGSFCAIPVNMIDSHGNIIKAVKGEDVLVDPEYRKGNTYLRIADLLLKKCNEEGIKYYWGLGDNPVHNKLMKFNTSYYAQQGVFVFGILKSYKFLSKLNPNNKFLDYVKIMGLCILAKFNSYKRIFQNTNLGSFQFQEVKAFNNFDLFLNSVDSDNLYMFIEQNEAYLKWRLYDNPHPNNYKEFVLVNSNKEVVAHAVINKREEGFAYICQLLFHIHLDDNLKTAFIKRLILHLKKEKVYLIRAYGVDSNKYNKEQITLMESLGFIFVKRGITFQWKTLKQGDKNFDVKNVLLTRLYNQGTI